jgi:hypothetical protein
MPSDQRCSSGLLPDAIEIAGLQQQGDIGEECRAGNDVGAQLRIGGRQHPQPAQHQGRRQHHDQGREDPPDPPDIEGHETEALLIQFARDNACDQKAGNDEEDIDADEAARQSLREAVKIHHQHHGNGAETVNIRSISLRRLGQIGPILVLRPHL